MDADNKPNDRKPCGCLKAVACTHKQTVIQFFCPVDMLACNNGCAGILDSPDCRLLKAQQLRDPPQDKLDSISVFRVGDPLIVSEGSASKAIQVEATLAERGSRYGDFADNARISQQLESIAFAQPGAQYMEYIHREALKFIFQKISRIVNGDPNYADNWHDIQGYAKLVEDHLPKEKP